MYSGSTAPPRRNETGVWWRRHDEYDTLEGMPMPGHNMARRGASFLAMWVVMMVAMMLPSWSRRFGVHRQAGSPDDRAVASVTSPSGPSAGWRLFCSASRLPAPARSRSASSWFMPPAAVSTAWKAVISPVAGTSYARPDRLATRPEPRSPLQSVLLGLMAILLVLGVMDLRAMAIVAAASRRTSRTGPAVDASREATGAVALGRVL